MHSSLLAVLFLIGTSLLHAMPSPFVQGDDYGIEDSQGVDPVQFHYLAKRLQNTPWIFKRNPAACDYRMDYRLQLRPLPLTSALCAFGEQRTAR